MKVLSFSNQKGGVGKTTLAYHMAHFLAGVKSRVLVIDADQQASMTGALFPDMPLDHEFATSANIFIGKGDEIRPNSVRFEFGKSDYSIDFLLAGEGLYAVNLIDAGQLTVFKKTVNRRRALLAEHYDFVIIDTQPALAVSMTMALMLSDYVVTPTSLSHLDMRGFSDLLDTVKSIRTSGLNPNLKHLGVVANKVSHNGKKQRKQIENIAAEFGKLFISPPLANRASVAAVFDPDARGAFLPVWAGSSGAQRAAGAEWKILCANILEKMR